MPSSRNIPLHDPKSACLTGLNWCRIAITLWVVICDNSTGRVYAVRSSVFHRPEYFMGFLCEGF